MKKNVIINCECQTKEELYYFLNKFDLSDDNCCIKINPRLIQAGINNGFNPISMIKARGYKVFLELGLQVGDLSIPTIIQYAIAGGVSYICTPDYGDSRVMMEVKKAVDDTLIKGNLQNNYENYYQNGMLSEEEYLKCKQLYSGKLPVWYISPVLIGKTTIVGKNLCNDTIKMDLLSMSDVIALCKAYKENGYDGVVCLPEEASCIKDELGDDFSLIAPSEKMNCSTRCSIDRMSANFAHYLGYSHICLPNIMNRKYPNYILMCVKKLFLNPTMENDKSNVAFYNSLVTVGEARIKNSGETRLSLK